MGKTLKVCLAMGGGVSLGAFSGSALTEALKLLVLYGQDKNGDPYDDVVLDGISGASAGSISLAIMMRVLLDYKRYLDYEGVKKYFDCDDSYEIVTKIQSIVKEKYKLEPEEWTEDKLSKIVALEVAQAVQYIIWVDKLDISKILDPNKEYKHKDPFGLMSKDFLLDLSKEYLMKNISDIVIENKRILGDRVLMAFSMANLSPIAYGDKDATEEKEDNHMASTVNIDLVNSLQAATNIDNHNELRVFDFILTSDKIEQRDDRYFSVFNGNLLEGNADLQNECKSLLDDDCEAPRSILQKQETWSHIAASAMASGAFPMAFEPVILKRWKSEYTSDEWPDSRITKDDLEPRNTMNFAYVDGGAFNNEPIKEAFKMGYCQDFNSGELFEPDEKKRVSERLVLFVDPSVPNGEKLNQLKSLDSLKHMNEKFESEIQPQSSKMIANVMDISSMIISQSQINEEAKVADFYKTALLKNAIVEFLTQVKDYDFGELLSSNIVPKFAIRAEKFLRDKQISIGTRDMSELLMNKYRELCKYPDDVCLTKFTFVELFEMLKKPETVKKDIDDFFILHECDKRNQQIVAQTIFVTLTEYALNQTGKSEAAERAGIFPIDDAFEIESLPGSEMFAFAGFLDINARRACFYKGRLDAEKCLKVDHFRNYHYHHSLKKENQEYKPYISINGEHAINSKADVYSENNSDLDNYKNLKTAYFKTISTKVTGDFRDNMIARFLPIFKELYKPKDRLKALGGAILGLFKPKLLLKFLLKKEMLSDYVSMESPKALKIQLASGNSEGVVTIHSQLDGARKVKTASTEGKMFKIYWGKFDDDNKRRNPVNDELKKGSLYINEKILKRGDNRRITKIEIGPKSLSANDLLLFLYENKKRILKSINPIIELKVADDITATIKDSPEDTATLIQNYEYEKVSD